MVCLTEFQRSLETPAVHVAPHAFQPQPHPGKGMGGGVDCAIYIFLKVFSFREVFFVNGGLVFLS